MIRLNVKSALLALAAISMLASCGTKSTGTNEWELVWSDTFDRSETLDSTKWTRIPRGGSDWNRHMSLREDLVEIKDGKMVLWGVANDRPDEDTARFITGGVWTKETYSYKYGKIEIKAKLESATGAWPAFWMLGATNVHGGYPHNGEIDLMEHLNYDSIVYQTVHSHYTLNHGIKDNPVSGGIGRIDPDGWNTYGMEWTADSMVFLVNDKKTFSYPRIETELDGQYPFDEPFYLLIDMQLGGSWVGAVDMEQLPVKMEIDWVKIWQQK